MELKGKTVLFLGDSITQGGEASCPENIYWQVFGRNTGAHVWADGISGTRIAANQAPEAPGFEHLSRYFASRVPDMPDKADAVVVFGGTNDFNFSDAPLGTMADRKPATFYGALHCLYRALLEKYPTAEIVVMTPTHRCEEDAPVNALGIRTAACLKRYVEAIREVAEYYGLPVLNLYAMGGIQPEVPIIREGFMPDGLHPSDAGHARIASRLAGFLRTL
ncbi:MAG: SGNH/GDSL hydrolase family protein [Clostridia bacterium]|nr:SGNH/GDSL hydrolase family protein [Clostridia bacterium]